MYQAKYLSSYNCRIKERLNRAADIITIAKQMCMNIFIYIFIDCSNLMLLPFGASTSQLRLSIVANYLYAACYSQVSFARVCEILCMHSQYLREQLRYIWFITNKKEQYIKAAEIYRFICLLINGAGIVFGLTSEKHLLTITLRYFYVCCGVGLLVGESQLYVK